MPVKIIAPVDGIGISVVTLAIPPAAAVSTVALTGKVYAIAELTLTLLAPGQSVPAAKAIPVSNTGVVIVEVGALGCLHLRGCSRQSDAGQRECWPDKTKCALLDLCECCCSHVVTSPSEPESNRALAYVLTRLPEATPPLN